eukprot:gene11090-11245_t
MHLLEPESLEVQTHPGCVNIRIGITWRPFAAPIIGNLLGIVRHDVHDGFLELCRNNYGKFYKVEPPGMAPKAQGIFPQLMLGARTHSTGLPLEDEQVQQQLLLEVDAFGRSKAVSRPYLVQPFASRSSILHPIGGLVLVIDPFPLVDAIIKETLRLYRPGTIATRSVTDGQGYQLTPEVHGLGWEQRQWGGDLSVAVAVWLPAGTALFSCISCLHQDVDYWPLANQWRPDRGLLLQAAVDLAPTTPDAYQPFGAGPRLCVGMKFALQDVAITLVRLYQQYSIKLQPPLEVKHTFALAPAAGLYVSLRSKAAARQHMLHTHFNEALRKAVSGTVPMKAAVRNHFRELETQMMWFFASVTNVLRLLAKMTATAARRDNSSVSLTSINLYLLCAPALVTWVSDVEAMLRVPADQIEAVALVCHSLEDFLYTWHQLLPESTPGTKEERRVEYCDRMTQNATGVFCRCARPGQISAGAVEECWPGVVLEAAGSPASQDEPDYQVSGIDIRKTSSRVTGRTISTKISDVPTFLSDASYEAVCIIDKLAFAVYDDVVSHPPDLTNARLLHVQRLLLDPHLHYLLLYGVGLVAEKLHSEKKGRAAVQPLARTDRDRAGQMEPPMGLEAARVALANLFAVLLLRTYLTEPLSTCVMSELALRALAAGVRPSQLPDSLPEASYTQSDLQPFACLIVEAGQVAAAMRQQLSQLVGQTSSLISSRPTVPRQAALAAAQELMQEALQQQTSDLRKLLEHSCGEAPADGDVGGNVIGAEQCLQQHGVTPTDINKQRLEVNLQQERSLRVLAGTSQFEVSTLPVVSLPTYLDIMTTSSAAAARFLQEAGDAAAAVGCMEPFTCLSGLLGDSWHVLQDHSEITQAAEALNSTQQLMQVCRQYHVHYKDVVCKMLARVDSSDHQQEAVLEAFAACLQKQNIRSKEQLFKYSGLFSDLMASLVNLPVLGELAALPKNLHDVAELAERSLDAVIHRLLDRFSNALAALSGNSAELLVRLPGGERPPICASTGQQRQVCNASSCSELTQAELLSSINATSCAEGWQCFVDGCANCTAVCERQVPPADVPAALKVLKSWMSLVRLRYKPDADTDTAQLRDTYSKLQAGLGFLNTQNSSPFPSNKSRPGLDRGYITKSGYLSFNRQGGHNTLSAIAAVLELQL